MDFHFRALLFTTVVTCHQICVLGKEDVLRNPERIYKMHPSLTRDSLFTRTIQRPNTNSCLVGKSVDSVSDVEKRRFFDCPTNKSILNVTYSAVFHEEHVNLTSAEPMWTILLDLDIHPLALNSLTGFMFQYKSLVSLRPLTGEPGFIYQNLPLRRGDFSYAGNQITLKAPYRNDGKFEISICPLPLCLIEDGEKLEDCTKIKIKVPNWKEEAFEDVMSKLPTFLPENDNNCDRSSLIKTSKLRSILLEPENIILTFKNYNSSYDLVFLTELGRSWFSTYLCPDTVYHKLQFLQSVEEEGRFSMEMCFLQGQKEETRDWTLLVVVVGACVSLIVIAAIVVIVAAVLYCCFRCRKKIKKERLFSSCKIDKNKTYDDIKEMRLCIHPKQKRDNISEALVHFDDPAAPINPDNSIRDSGSNTSSMTNTTTNATGAFERINDSGPYGIFNLSEQSGNQRDSRAFTAITESDNTNSDVSTPGDNTYDPPGAAFGPLNSSAPQNNTNSSMNTSANISSINNTTADSMLGCGRINTSAPHDIQNLSASSQSKDAEVAGYDTIAANSSINDSVYDPALSFGRVNTSGSKTIHNYSETNGRGRRSLMGNVSQFFRDFLGFNRRNPLSSRNSTSALNTTEGTDVNSSNEVSLENPMDRWGKINTSGPRNIHNISEEDVGVHFKNEADDGLYPIRTSLNETIHPLISNGSCDSGKSGGRSSESDSGNASGSGSGSGSLPECGFLADSGDECTSA